MRKVFSLLLLVVTATLCSCDISQTILNKFMDGHPKELFKVFHTVYPKDYSLDSQEGVTRYKIFKTNLKFIKETNKQGNSFTLGLTQFADLTNEEYRKLYIVDPIVFKQQKEDFIKNSRFLLSNDVNFDNYNDEEETTIVKDDSVPKEVNHNDKMAPVRDQKLCPASWALSVAATVEAALFIKGTNPGKEWLSIQQLIDCNNTNRGCSKGDPQFALEYIKSKGIVQDKHYKYTSGDTPKAGTCKPDTDLADKNKSKITDFVYKTRGTEIASWRKNVSTGPSVVTIDASSDAFRFYVAGILEPSKMACTSENHTVVAIAYDSNDVITARNSLGEKWGEKGNFRIRYDRSGSNTCFVTSCFYRPIV